jgi:DNA-binding LacI/PurR family transcriptional regulator
MPTMLDVAQRAGIALSTVSYAINGTQSISEETRQRIFAVMDELDYRPHTLARGLASKCSRIIALHFSVFERGLGITELEFVTSAADAATEKSYSLILWPSEMHSQDELGRLGAELLIQQLEEQEKRVTQVLLPCRLVVRGSSGPCRRNR